MLSRTSSNRRSAKDLRKPPAARPPAFRRVPHSLPRGVVGAQFQAAAARLGVKCVCGFGRLVPAAIAHLFVRRYSASMKTKCVAVASLTFLLLGIVGCSTSTPKPNRSAQQTSGASPLRDAYLLYKMGEFDPAEQRLHVVLQKEPDNPAAQHLLGMVHEAERKPRLPWGYYPTIPQQPIYR